MSVTDLLIENNFKLQNLALLICHLFVGGNFRQIYLIHDHKIVDCPLVQEINRHCSNTTWIVSDLYKPKPSVVERSGYDTLQLFIIEQHQYYGQMQLVESFEAYYSIFVVDSNIQQLFKQTETLITARSSLAMFHDSTGDTVQSILLTGAGEGHSKIVQFNHSQLNVLTPEAAFEMTFGERERIREVGIFIDESFCDNGRNRIITNSDYRNFFLGNLLFRQMNMSVIKTQKFTCNPAGNETFFSYRRIPQPVYNEISFNSEFVRMNTRSNIEELEYVTLFFLDATSLRTFANYLRRDRIFPSSEAFRSPFRYKIFFEFIYGDDFNRSNTQQIFAMILNNAWIFCLLIGVSIVVLCFIRWKANLRRGGVMSFFDVLIAVIGGGNLQYNHKWERIFFAILLFGAFFLNTICTDTFLYYTFSFGRENRMDSMEKMVEFNTPIHLLDMNLREKHMEVEEMVVTKLGLKEWVNLDVIDANKSRAFVKSEHQIQISQTFNGDIDKEYFDLGETDFPIFSTIYGIMPESAATEFQKLMAYLVESGLYQFYSSYASFLTNIRTKSENNVMQPDEYGPIVFDQIYFYLLMYSSCLLVATMVFLFELAVDYSKKITVTYNSRKS